MQVGSLAHACLAPGLHGKVLASFSNAIYLLTDDAELFWIVAEDVPMHRRGLKISSPPSGPEAGSPFHVEDHRLLIDPGFAYDMDTALQWHPPQISRRKLIDIIEIPSRIEALFSSFDLSPARGFGHFIPDILRLAQNEPIHPEPTSADPILALARPLVLDTARTCLEHQPSRILQNANVLIGLGSGLTPSGDDFLGSLLFCMKTLQEPYPELNLLESPPTLEPYRERTHPISFILMQDMVNGHTIAPLHQLVNGILTGKSSENVGESITELMRVGHSTGWDMLAGLLTGLLTTFHNPSLLRSARNYGTDGNIARN